jgi:restriction system protein
MDYPQEAEREALRESVKKQVAALIRPEHLPVLIRKYRQTVRLDEYGEMVLGKWTREIFYYLEEVLARGVTVDEVSREWISPRGCFRADAITVVLDALRDFVTSGQADHLLGQQVEFDDSMSGAAFERLCADELRRAGWHVQLIGATGDQGGDLIAEKEGRRVLIQCKQYSYPVGNTAVQEAFAGMRHHGANLACVVSNASYTKGAVQLATSTGVRLLHYLQLCELDRIT